MGAVYNGTSEYSNALEYYDKSHKIREKSLSLNHPDLAISYSNIGQVYENMGEYSKSLKFYEKSHIILEKALPPNHPHLTVSHLDFATCYEKMGNYTEAFRSFENTFHIGQKNSKKIIQLLVQYIAGSEELIVV